MVKPWRLSSIVAMGASTCKVEGGSVIFHSNLNIRWSWNRKPSMYVFSINSNSTGSIYFGKLEKWMNSLCFHKFSLKWTTPFCSFIRFSPIAILCGLRLPGREHAPSSKSPNYEWRWFLSVQIYIIFGVVRLFSSDGKPTVPQSRRPVHIPLWPYRKQQWNVMHTYFMISHNAHLGTGELSLITPVHR